jgi:PKD repeat protein
MASSGSMKSSMRSGSVTADQLPGPGPDLGFRHLRLPRSDHRCLQFPRLAYQNAHDVQLLLRAHPAEGIGFLLVGGGASNALDTAIRNSIAAGVTYVVAAINQGDDACKYSPARVREALTVGATNSSDEKASWSNYGPCVDLFAPGAGITSAFNTSNTATAVYSGTSMSSPHAAGVAALYLETDPAAPPATVFAAVTNATTKGIVTLSPPGNNHLLYSLAWVSGGGPQPPPNEPPTASFTYSCTDLTCSFTDTSTDADGQVVAWSWSFGDGGASGARHPTHTFAEAGTYTVALTVTDDDGATGSVSQAVTASDGQAPPPGGDAPVASFDYSCRNTDTCEFTDTSTGDITAWSWTFANAEPETSGVENPTTTFQEAGNHEVKLTVTAGDQNDTHTRTISCTFHRVHGIRCK